MTLSCGRSLAPAAPVEKTPPSPGEPAAGGGAGVWQTATRSPRPPEIGENAALGPLCRPDAALAAAAEQYASAVAAGATPEAGEVELWLRMLGSPYVWPRAWARAGAGDGKDAPFESWLAGFETAGERRCGHGYARRGATRITALVAIDALADLDPLPLRARVGAWLTLEARLLVPASGAKVVLLGPTGAPRPIPTSFDERGRVRAPFALRERGRFLVQVLAEVPGGPRPVLEASIFADLEPPADPRPERAPGEDAGADETDAANAIFAMLSGLRAAERLEPLVRHAELDRVALAHATEMRDAGRIGHDVGSGGPAQRLAAAGIVVTRAGENLAHAASARLAHRKLHASPSHRANLLSTDFDSVGIGVVSDANGLLWVCQIYARARE